MKGLSANVRISSPFFFFFSLSSPIRRFSCFSFAYVPSSNLSGFKGPSPTFFFS